ncbi:MAG TPA: magnesium chelatase domain-containing protein, partial [Clostridiales bacterium]|nr:magnesium chelatase domain-containing protein [Clostridiales bacterium]
MSSDFRGDPASAMLEVLDGEQNFAFRDHYLELPVDLSDVLFLTTANSLDTIPRPLLDRMEVITISGYTEEEKVQIAQRYLVNKQMKAHGLQKKNLKITEDAIRCIINYYTREAGVRNLEREIANICRKAAKLLVSGSRKSVTVTPSNIEKYLGTRRYRFDKANEKDEVGVATGLAWTPVGGDTLAIEVTVMDGSGKLELTGQLGDVMKESAMAAVSFIRSRAELLGIDREFYKKYDIHIHVPEGATPKDGPSAGITLATAMVSALTGRAVKRNVAMTGEITLRGRVLPIGGVKEKVLAAHRAGIDTVILPAENRKDIDEIPVNVRSGLKFVFVEEMDTVLNTALTPEKNHRDIESGREDQEAVLLAEESAAVDGQSSTHRM